jgi:Tol biopolymer transport system component
MRNVFLRCAGILVLVFAVACGGQPEAPVEEAEVEAEVVVNFIHEGVWSPRGDRLMVTWDQGGRSRLFGVLAPDTFDTAQEPGSGLRVSDGPDSRASWSPAGDWVAFGSTRDGQGEIYRMRPDGMELVRLTNDPAHDTDPAYSPDGRRIAFISTRTDGAARLHIMDADGGNVSMVSSGPGIAHSSPEWEPGGRRLAVQVTMDDGEYIFVATPEGGWGRVKGGASPSWASNGDDIFLERNDSILVAGTSAGSLRFVLANGRAPRSSPDGRWLSFVRGTYPTSALFALDLVTGEEYPLTRE